MPGGADCAGRNDRRLPCQARAGLRAVIPVLPAGCVSRSARCSSRGRAGAMS
jgi:hypothetical protein